MPAGTGGEVRESLPLVSGPRQPVPAAIQTASVSPWHSTGALKKPASGFHRGSPRQAELALSSALPLATARHAASKTDVRHTLDRDKGDVAAPASTPFPASRLPIQRMAGIGDATSQAPAATGASGIVNGEPTEPTVSGRLDELELERIADAVYEIIENRLIVERESLGL